MKKSFTENLRQPNNIDHETKFYSQPNPFDAEMVKHLVAAKILPRRTPFKDVPDLETFYTGLSKTVYVRGLQVEAYKDAHLKHGDWLVRMRAEEKNKPTNGQITK